MVPNTHTHTHITNGHTPCAAVTKLFDTPSIESTHEELIIYQRICTNKVRNGKEKKSE